MIRYYDDNKAHAMLNADLFDFALSRGLGDAYVWLQEYSDHQAQQETIRECLLAACLSNDVYDPQCEEPRHEWLLDLLDLTTEPQYYHQHIIHALTEQHDDFWDNYQRVDLCACLAARGNVAAWQVLYDFFRRFPHNNHFLAADQLLQLEGLSYLPTIVRCIGQQLLASADKTAVWDNGDFMRNTFEQFGKDKVNACVQQLARYDEAIAMYWKHCDNTLNHEPDDKWEHCDSTLNHEPDDKHDSHPSLPNDNVESLRLMVNHYENADAARINQQLHQVLEQGDDDVLHQVCRTIIEIFTLHPHEPLLDTVVCVAMVTPSSLDRYSALSALFAHSAFVHHKDYQEVVQTVAFDCDETIRALADIR
ncbi:MAG: hypothetical protein ACWA5U_01405 [bacterium]